MASHTSSAENLNNANQKPAEPDDGPILEQLDDKRCGICHEIIMKVNTYSLKTAFQMIIFLTLTINK